MGKSLRNRIFTSVKLLIHPLASCSFKDFDFLLLHTAHFEKSIILPFSVHTV